jgi:NitT/TauT family transport system ATP-binding protein
MTAQLDDAPVIRFDHVDKVFPGHRALHDLSFEIARGELVSIVGVTGCGKSTTFGLTVGLTEPTSGEVRVCGHDPYAEFAWFRRRLAVVFQDPRLLPWRTVLQNVHAGMKFAGVPRESWDATARDWLHRLGLGGKEDAYPHALSGGQRQRVSLARAFAVDPDIILCDESFSALDEVTSVALRQEFTALVRDNHKTGVVITHSINEALTIGNRVLVLRPPGHLADDISVPAGASPAELEELRERVLSQMTPQVGTLESAGGAA